MTPTLNLDTALGPMQVYAEGTITRALQAGQWWDSHLKPHLDSVPNGWAVDIGAHFGWFTRYLSQHHTVVIACEPWPPSFALLMQNLWHNRLDGRWHGDVQCWPVAAYHRPDLLAFYSRNVLEDAGSFAFVPSPDVYVEDRVPAIRLDDYLPATAPISLVKCDAQGADLQALQGMERTIRRCRPLILFEWEEGLAQQQGSDWGDYLAFFEQIGYAPPERISQGYWDYVARPE